MPREITSVFVLPCGMGRLWGTPAPTAAEEAERKERVAREHAASAAQQADAAEHWAARLAEARSAHAHLSTYEYLAHVLFYISRDNKPGDLQCLYDYAVKCFHEYVLQGRFMRDLAGDIPDLASPYGIGPVLYTYHRFKGNGRYRFPTFDLGQGEEENPDSDESWAGFAQAVIAMAATA